MMYGTVERPDGRWDVFSAVTGEWAATVDTEAEAADLAFRLNRCAQRTIGVIEALLRPHAAGHA